MRKDDLIPGDVVQLKSGGPSMTYEGENTLGSAMCVWLTLDGECRSATFSHATLKRADE